MRNEWIKRIMRSRPIMFTGAVLILLTTGIIVAGAASVAGDIGLAKESGQEENNTGFKIAKPGSYDSEDTAVIKEISTENSKITFMNIETGKSYTLTYDGTVPLKDKYDSSIALTQIQEGDIVDITFLRGKKKLSGLKLSNDSWVYESLEKYNLDILSKSAEIGSDIYSLQNNLVVTSEGSEAQLEDIVKGDVVTVRGIGRNVHSISVDRGHGYLRLSDEEYLNGGWIEVGQAVIQQITEDMLLAVPEGTYDVRLTASNIDETRQITVYRNQEVTLDVSDVKAEEAKKGKIIFAVTPKEAEVFIDGSAVDISEPVELEYGVHQMIVKAEGYDSVTQYLKVAQAMASISVSLEESESGSDQGIGNSSSVSGNELTSSYRVYIDSPSDVEVYLDSVYVGMSPVNFKKEAGTHTITLRRTGYVTKSYTVQIDDEEKDITFSFTDLVKEDGSNTVSGNYIPRKPGDSVSDNSSVSGNSSGKGSVSGN